jgi:ribonuclease HI
MDKIITYTAGASRGNPGPAAVGVYIVDKALNVVDELKQSLGNSNSSFAEYYAVMLALQTLMQLYADKTKTMQFEIKLDSDVVKGQLNDELPINEPGLVPMFIEIHNMRVASFPNLQFTLVNGDKNNQATRLANEALEGK